MRYRRLTSAVAGGAVLTGALIYWMQALITTGEPAPPAARPIHVAPPVLGRPVPPPHRPPRVEPLKDPMKPPSLTTVDATSTTPRGRRIPLGRNPVTPGFDGSPDGNDGPWTPDGEYLLLTPIQPAYPARAERLDLEGTVVLEFTITERGTAADIAVVRSTHPVFEAAARSALARYRYEPRVVQGTPVAVPGVRVEFVFEFDD